jgi:hypothetical protein
MNTAKATQSDSIPPSSSRFPAAPVSERPTRPPASGVISYRGEPDDLRGFRIYDDADGGIELRIESLGVEATVERLNPVAIYFRAPDAEMLLHETVEVTLRWKGAVIGPVKGRVEVNLQDPSEYCFRIALRDLSFPTASAMMQMLHTLLSSGGASPPKEAPQAHEEIHDSDRIKKIINALTILSEGGTLRGPGLVAPVRLLGLVGEREIQWQSAEGAVDWGRGPWTVEVLGYNSVYVLSLDSVTADGASAKTPIPTSVTRTRHRYFRRCPVTKPRMVRYLHPRWNQDGITERALKDVSYGGLCFEIDPAQDILFPGLRIPLLTIEGDDGDPIRLTGTIRSIAPTLDGKRMVCGVSVAPWCAEDEPQWIKLVARELHPRTDTSENLLEALWDLFDASGYFNLAGRSAEDFAALKKRFLTVGRRAVHAPQLICQAVWPSSKGVEGSVSFLKAYQTAWMGHQLAKRHGANATPSVEPSQVLRDVYFHSFEHPQTDPDLRWVVGHVEGQVRWVMGSHVEFVRQHQETGEVLAIPVGMMYARCKEHAKVDARGITVAPASPLEKQLLARRVAQKHPACYADAFDFVPERIGLERVTDMWRVAGMERERAILVAHAKNRPVAAIVLETGEEGTNLFRLLDSARVFALSAGVTPEAYVALFNEAREWYAARGRTEFLFFKEDREDSYVAPAGLHQISEPYLWIVSARLVPDFLEHVSEVAGGRPKPKERSARGYDV